MKLVLDTAVQREPLTAAEEEALVATLAVLPYFHTRRRISAYLLHTPWMNHPNDLMKALEWDQRPGMLRMVADARDTGGGGGVAEVVQDVRAPDGWSIHWNGNPWTLGQLEGAWQQRHDVRTALAAGTEPPITVLAAAIEDGLLSTESTALPPPFDMPTTGDRQAREGVLLALAAAQGNDRARVQAIVASPPPSPDRLKLLAIKADAMLKDAEDAKHLAVVAEQLWLERLRELSGELSAADAPIEVAHAAFKQLAARLVADPLVGFDTVLADLVAAWRPDLHVAKVEAPRDAFEDEQPTRLRIHLEQVQESPITWPAASAGPEKKRDVRIHDAGPRRMAPGDLTASVRRRR
jgi:hypothetical protein